jgi:hypothetical protein
MAWDPLIRGETSSKAKVAEEYSGDKPWDAFGGALGRIATEADGVDEKRLPKVSELVLGLRAALESQRTNLFDRSAIDTRLSQWSGLKEISRPKRARAKSGDVLAIEYAVGHAVYAHVLFAPTKEEPGHPVGLGICVVVFDRDVVAGASPNDNLAEIIATAKPLLGPLHPGEEQIKEGTWRILGNVPVVDRASKLPTFSVTANKDGTWATVTRDYFDNEIPSTPENRKRVRPMTVYSGGTIRSAIRGARGMARWLPTFDELRASS